MDELKELVTKLEHAFHDRLVSVIDTLSSRPTGTNSTTSLLHQLAKLLAGAEHDQMWLALAVISGRLPTQDEVIWATLVDELGHHDARQYMLKFSGEESPDVANFTSIVDSLERLVDAQVLFLPTYRRIEQDLKAIFPGLESDVAKYRERQSTRSAKR